MTTRVWHCDIHGFSIIGYSYSSVFSGHCWFHCCHFRLAVALAILAELLRYWLLLLRMLMVTALVIAELSLA